MPIPAPSTAPSVAPAAVPAAAPPRNGRSAHAVAIVAKIDARAGRRGQMDLARKRTLAVRQVLESNGIPLGTMRVEISELPTGLVSAAEANRVEVAFH